PVERLLDFGCNTGRLTGFLSDFTDEIYGADIDEGYEKKLAESCSKAKFGLIKNNKLPFSDEFFDIVFSCKVFQHFSEKVVVEMGLEIKRVLKIGGKLIIYEGLRKLPYGKDRFDIMPLKKINIIIIEENRDHYELITFKK
ncbi:unnamed protein product, partial [marine sediment metagenome]